MSLGPMSANAMAQRSPNRDRERRPMERNDRAAGADAGLRRKRKPRKSAAFLTGGRLPGRLPSTVIANPGEKRCTVLRKIARFARRCKRF
jgi:hypothetical protein